MRALILLAMLGLLAVSVAGPASADHVHYTVPVQNLYCFDTAGADAYGNEVWVGSGHDGVDRCQVHAHVDP